jgi:hypothetical protein
MELVPDNDGSDFNADSDQGLLKTISGHSESISIQSYRSYPHIYTSVNVSKLANLFHL